jgi:hypothetical protein
VTFLLASGKISVHPSVVVMILEVKEHSAWQPVT